MRDKIKSLASDTFIYGISTIVGRFLTFLLVPFYTNALTKDEFGSVTYLFSILAFLNIFFSFGLESAFFRFFDKEDKEKTAGIFTMAFAAIGGISLIFTLVLAAIIPFDNSKLTDISGGAPAIQLSLLIAFFDALMLVPFARLRMLRKARKFASIKFLLIFIAVSLNLLFVLGFRWGIFGVIWAQLLASIIGVIIHSKDIFSQIRLHWNGKVLKEMFRYGLPTLPANFSSIILQVSDRPIIQLLLNTQAVAIYGANFRLGIPMMLFVSVFEYAWRPFYLSHYKEEGAKELFARIMTYFTMICAAIFLIGAFFMPYFVRIPIPFANRFLIHPDYWEGLAIIPIVLGAYYFNGVFYNISAGFHITKKTKYFPFAVGAGALLSVVMNFTLLPIFGYTSAAWAALAAYFLSAALLFIYSRRVYPINYEWKRLAFLISLTIAIYLATDYFTEDMSLNYGFIVKIAALALLGIILWIGKFFNQSEMRLIKRLFIRK